MKRSTVLVAIVAFALLAGCSSGLQLKKLSDEEFIELGRQALKANRVDNVEVENNFGYIKITGIKPSGKYTRLIETTVTAGRNESVNRSAVEDFRIKYFVLIESFTQPENGRTVEIKGYLPVEIPPDPELPPDNPGAGATNQLKWIPSDPRVNLEELIADTKATFYRLWQESSMAAAGITPPTAPVTTPEPQTENEPGAATEEAAEPWGNPAGGNPAGTPAASEQPSTPPAPSAAAPSAENDTPAATDSSVPPDEDSSGVEQPDIDQATE